MKKNKIYIMLIVLAMIFVASMTAFGCSKSDDSDDSENTVDVVFDSYFYNSAITIGVDETYTLNVMNAKIKEWSSSNTSVAIVNNEGIVTGKAEGVAFIYAVSEDDQTFCCIVSVNVPNVSVLGLELSESEYIMGLNDVFALTVDVMYEEVDLGEVVDWSVSNSGICSIEEQGNKVYITANGVGETFVVASLGGKVAQCKLIIREQSSNNSSFENIPSQMATAKMTKNYYELGRINSGVVESGIQSTIYETAIYGESSEKYSIIAFATLTDGKKDLNWTAQNFFAYGFYLKTIQVYDSDFGMQGADRIYYAYNGTNDDGKFGVEITNVPDGYYAIYSFVEYVDNGVIVKEISSERVLLGEYKPEFVNSSSDFKAYMMNRKYEAGIMAGSETKVVEKSEAYSGIPAKYQIAAPVMARYNGAWNVFPTVMVKAQTTMSKEMLKEVLGDGISILRFKVCYRIVSDNTFRGVLETTNFAVLDDTFPKTVTDVETTKPPTYYDGVSSRDTAYEEYIAKAMSKREIESNVWYTVEYKIKDLIEDYDTFFHEKAEYPFFAFAMNDSEDNQAGNSNDGKVLISEFEFVNVAYDDIFAEKDSYSFIYSRNGIENYYDSYTQEDVIVNWQYTQTKPNQSNRACNPVEAESGVYDGVYKGKEVAYKFEYTLMAGADGQITREQNETGRYLLMTFENRLITKELLEELISLGYKDLSFSVVVYDYGRGNSFKMQLIDFDYLKANPSATVLTTDRYGTVVNWKAFKLVNVKAEKARDWYTVSYSIEDLLACYDQIFSFSQVLLAQACADYTEGDTAQDKHPYFYITKVGFKKGIDISNSEELYPDIFD